MRVGLRARTLDEDRLAVCEQIGADDVFVDHRDPRGDVFADGSTDRDETTIAIDEGLVASVDDLREAKERAAAAGVRLAGIQCSPTTSTGRSCWDGTAWRSSSRPSRP